jgi:hypothetical protein
MADNEPRRIFLSWSGTSSSIIAERLRDWLPLLIDIPEPWMSKSSIADGARWLKELSAGLEGSNFGIVVVTPENVNSSWLVFEAGALSKNVEEGRVIPYLVGLRSRELPSPLTHFQAAKADRSGTWKLVTSIAEACDLAISRSVLEKRFEHFWLEMEDFLEKSKRDLRQDLPAPKTEPDRLTWDDIHEAVDTLAKQLRYEQNEPTMIIGSGKGGAICGALLAKQLQTPFKVFDLVKPGAVRHIDYAPLRMCPADADCDQRVLNETQERWELKNKNILVVEYLREHAEVYRKLHPLLSEHAQSVHWYAVLDCSKKKGDEPNYNYRKVDRQMFAPWM